MTIPQPPIRRRLYIRCSCGRGFYGPSGRAGGSFKRYAAHWKQDHEGKPACRRCRVWRGEPAPAMQRRPPLKAMARLRPRRRDPSDR